MAIEGFLNNVDDLHGLSSIVHDHFEDGGKALKYKITDCGKRSLSQNAFQHIIYQEISKYLISKGRTDWTPEYTKENMKNAFLGWKDKEYIDVKTGKRSVRSVLRKTSTLDKGDSFRFTTDLIGFSESIGLMIKIPESSDYMKFKNEQNE